MQHVVPVVRIGGQGPESSRESLVVLDLLARND